MASNTSSIGIVILSASWLVGVPTIFSPACEQNIAAQVFVKDANEWNILHFFVYHF